MKIIDGVAHVVRSFDLADSFFIEVDKNIKNMQKVGMEVEVQYRQSESVVSALILGRREE